MNRLALTVDLLLLVALVLNAAYPQRCMVGEDETIGFLSTNDTSTRNQNIQTIENAPT